ncbi:MAG: hypothetical protein ACRDP3_21205 [Streptomyces sp.]|uniref:hypothetical protein n=1 Tax=Streptomyces sp. TaxID=1931 RepID=UPI003D6BCCC7
MNAEGRRGGYCAWHKGQADDVAPAVVIEQGSGPGGSAYACLPCARRLAQRPDAPEMLTTAVAEMEARADQPGQAS